MSMTIEEIKHTYGDADRDYYVSCENCPLKEEYITNPEVCPESPIGTYDCWEAIKQFLDDQEKANEPVEETQPEEPTYDVVHHPSHYCREGAMECIDEMLLLFGKEAVMHFGLLNAWKYRTRCLNKNGIEDLNKSDWYIQKYKELKESGMMDENR